MNESVIKIENLGKMYRIGAARAQHDTLRDALVARFRRDGHAKEDEILWALKDVSFEIKRGEVLGVIGRNGAGKSTLLRILSRITEPTTGHAEIHGRVGSLLEVGTGFHPELTGRENIYLNGAILGMQRAEINRKFDEIVAFAEIERFLDTPVKRYSSGMYVRLAFAVAAHLEPEILLVDEVLAVGDAGFQKKCLGKMGNVAEEGRTVLFVSHNMVALQSLCPRVVWLQAGRLIGDGISAKVIPEYLHASVSSQKERVWDDISTAPGNEIVRLRRVCVRPEAGSLDNPITMETPFCLEIEFWNLVPDARLHVTLHVHAEGLPAFSTSDGDDPMWGGQPHPIGLYRSVCRVPGNLLNNGFHSIDIYIVRDKARSIWRLQDALSFEVLDAERRNGSWFGREPGVVRPRLVWQSEHLESQPVIPLVGP